jgi:hypothetical protein
MQYRTTKTLFAAALVSLAVVLTAQTATAGPWVKAPGETYLKASGSYFTSDQVYDIEGNRSDPTYEYSHTGIGLYGELGILPRTALQFNTSFLMAKNQVNERIAYKNTGPSDLDVGLQFEILSSGCAVSASAAVRVPLYEEGVNADSSDDPLTTGSTAQNRFTPALGDGSVDLMPRAHFGCSLYPFPGWFTVMAGPRIRFDGFGNGFDYAAGFGAFVWPDRLALTARVGGTQRFSGDNESPTKSYVTVGGGFLLSIWKGLSLEGSASYIPTGAFVAQGWTLTTGLSFDGRLFANPFE